MDELAYSLNGENMHYGTPVNPACPDRIPGGSSSGSAVATANGDVDFALGSDTGGELRDFTEIVNAVFSEPMFDARDSDL
jgi:amidase